MYQFLDEMIHLRSEYIANSSSSAQNLILVNLDGNEEHEIYLPHSSGEALEYFP